MTIPFRHLLSIAVLFQALAGCVPLTQSRVVGGRTYDHFLYHEQMGSALLQIGPSNRKRAATVIPSESYATAPNGTRHRIATEPHAFDLKQGYPYVRERIYLLDDSGQRTTRKWKNGHWTFHFVLRTAQGKQTRDFQADLWTFLYNPAVHGPPN
jgi:hypothetical protein